MVTENRPTLAGLKKLRQAKGLTQVELARLTGLSVRTIARYENARSFPRVPMLGLQVLRKDRKATQLELGRAVGVSRRTISRYETESEFPEGSPFPILCKILDCQMWEMFHPDPIEARRDIELAKRG